MKEYNLVADGVGNFRQEFDPPLTKGERVRVTVRKGNAEANIVEVAPTSKYSYTQRPDEFHLAITGGFMDGYHMKVGNNETIVHQGLVGAQTLSSLSTVMDFLSKIRKMSMNGSVQNGGAMSSTPDLKELEILPDSTEVAPNLALNSKVESLILPETIKTIGQGAFTIMSGLTGTFRLPRDLEVIQRNGMSGMFNITELVCNNKLRRIENSGLSSLSSVTGQFDLPDTLEYLGNQAMVGWSMYDGNIRIPPNITFIGEEAISNFGGQDLTFAEGFSLTSIPRRAFYSWHRATSKLTLPEGVVDIGEQAFADHVYRTELELPTTIRSIDAYGFGGWYNVTKVTLKSPVKVELHLDAFRGMDESRVLIYVPSSLVSAYENDPAIAERGLTQRIRAIT